MCDICHMLVGYRNTWYQLPGVYFSKEVNMTLAKLPLKFNGALTKRGLTYLLK